MAINRSNLATAEPNINTSSSLYSYPQWKKINSEEDTSTEQDLPQYLDYYRTELFKKGELTRDREADIQNYYVNWASKGEDVSDVEFASLANQSTAYQSGNLNDERLVNKVFPNVDFAAIDSAKQSEYLNRSKRSLLASGDLPFATVLEGGRGTVEVGDFESLGTSPDKKKQASNNALSAVAIGAVDPRDLWQVSEGLESTRIANKTNFEADLDDEDLGLLREMLGDENSPYAKVINEAIVKSIDLESYRKEGNWWQQIFADRPEKITQVLAEELPEEIEELRPALLREFARRKGWGDAEAAGLDINNTYRFSDERVFGLIKELSILHTNNQGAFKYDEGTLKNNLRLTPMGVPIAHPTVMENPKAFNELLTDDRLSSTQRKALNESRRNYMHSRSYHIDNVLSSEHLESSVGDKWARAKAENPQKWKEDRVGFVDEFLSNEKNYDASKNWWGGVRASVPEAIVGIGASVGALLGNDASADYLKESQSKQSQRRELDGLFGGEFGIGYDLATILPAVGADLASTYFLAGPLTKVAKAAGVGGTKAVRATAKEQAIAKIAKEAAVNPKKTPLAIGRFNEQTAQKFGITSSLFLTSANRSAGATYASIYNSLPDEMSHEEKHDKALGAAFARGTLTGVITSGFSALGAGGLENIVARGASFRQFKNAINKVPNVLKANDETTKVLLRTTIAKQAAALYQKEAGSSLIKKALGAAAAEGAEEGLDEFIGSFVDSAVLNEFVPMKDRISQGLYAGGLGSILGGTMTVGSEKLFGPDRLLKSTTIKDDANRKTVALNKAITQASQALEEAGLVISADQLQEALQATKSVSETSTGEAPTIEGDPEIEGVAKDFDGALKGADAEPEAVPTSPRSLITNLGSKFTKEDVADYISGWVPTNTKDDIFIQYVDGKLTEQNPMRVGINSGTTDNPNIVLQIDTEQLTEQLKQLKGPAQRKTALNKMLAHELVHVSESSLLKDMWRKRSSQEEDLNFIQFSKKKLSEIYDSLNVGDGVEKLKQSVAIYKGIGVDEVILPDRAADGEISQMEKDEIVSEFTRQFIESETKLTDISEDPTFLKFLQDLVKHVRGFLDPNAQGSRDQYSFINKNVAEYLNDIEASYVDVLAKSLRKRFIDFDPTKEPNINQEATEEVEGEATEEVPSPEDDLWNEANNVDKRALTKKGIKEETEAKKQQAKIDKVEAYLLSDPEIQKSVSGFNRDILNAIKVKYESVVDSKIAKADSKNFAIPEISNRNDKNYVAGNTVKTIKELIIDSKKPDLNGVGQNSDSTDVFLTKVLLALGTNVATETQSAETIIDNNPPSKIFKVESKRVVSPLNNQQADNTTQFTEEANELLEEADVFIKNLARSYRKGNYGTYGATELAYVESNPIDDKYLELAQDPEANAKELQKLVDEAAKIAGYNIDPVYHGTRAFKFEAFDNFGTQSNDIGFHFGTKQAAKDRIEATTSALTANDGRIYKVFLKGKSLRLDEQGTIMSTSVGWPIDHILRQIFEGDTRSDNKGADHVIPPEFESDADAYFDGELTTEMVYDGQLMEVDPYDVLTVAEQTEWMDAYLKSKGYDSIVYENKVEDSGNDSYIVFNPNNIKLSDPVTYDKNGNVIPLSQRFDISKRSMLFSEEGITSGLTEEGKRDIKASPKEIRDFIRSGKVKKGWFKGGAADDITQGKTAEEVADYIILQTNNRAHASLLNRIKGYLKGYAVKAPVEGDRYKRSAHPSRVKGQASMDFLQDPEAMDIFKRNGGDSSWTTRNIYINERGLSSEIITHELVHAATEARLKAGLYDADKDSDLYKNVKELVGLVKGTVSKIPPKFKPLIDKGGQLGDFDYFTYTLNGQTRTAGRPSDTTISEFIAYGLSNVEFQNFLKSVQIKGEPDGLTKFVSFIRKVLGIPKDQNNALSELIRLTDNVLNAPKDAATMRAEEGQVAPWFEGPQPDNFDPATGFFVNGRRYAGPQTFEYGAYELSYESPKDSPDLDPISVEEGFIKTNEIALVNALANYRKTKGEGVPLDGYIESEFAIKSIEDGFLMDFPVESFADLGIENKFLSFMSSENVPLFGQDSLFTEDLIVDEEVVKSIVSRTLKKLTAEAISGKDYRDSLAIINSYPKLKEIAMASLDNTIETLTANLNPQLESNADKEIALKLDSLGNARTHLRKGYVFNPEKIIVYNGGANAEAGLEQIRNIVTKADDPTALKDIEKEFRTLIEVPIGQVGSYTSPIEGRSNWIKTFWSWFTGLKDPRWKREMERRESFMNGIRTEVESYIGQIERLVNEGWGGYNTEINTLLEQATGERNNIVIDEEVDTVLIAARDAAKLEASALETPKEVIAAVKKADRDYESAVIEEKQKIRQETLRGVNVALNKISEKSPELAETLRGLRYKITASSRYISQQLSKIDKDEYTDIEARFSAQEGFYLTRAYKMFEDPSWKEFIFSKDNPKAKALRLNAAREIFKRKQEDTISDEVIKKDKEAYANNDVDWITKSESAKRAEFSDLAKTLTEALEARGQSEEAFLESTFKHNYSTYGEDLDTDVLRKKKELPKAIREALGEIPDGTWNIVKTYENVSYLTNRLAVDANLERLGRAGEPDQRWLVTDKERIELGLDNYQLIDTVLKRDEGDKYSPLIGKNYYASPELLQEIEASRTFIQEGTRLTEQLTKSINGIVRKSIGYSLGIKTLTSTTYYIRNIVGNTTYFALSLGLPPGTGITKIKGELGRAIRSPKEVNEYVNRLIKDGVIEREFSVALYEDMVNGLITETSLRQETSDLLNEIQKENGLPPIEEDSDKPLLDTLKQVGKKGYKITKKLENKLQKLSLASDSFYKIAVYEYELNNLTKAKAYDKESGIDTGYAGKSDRELELMAIDKLKKTAQYFSQNMPGTEAFSQSTLGMLIAPYYRFRAEVGRIMVNNTVLAAQEIKSKNPVIRKRGIQRAAGAATVGAASTVATFAAEAALLIFVYGLGHRPADDLGDEEKEALQLSVPSYLRNHTFLYTKRNGKYYSWDLTYLNPYATYLDAFPAIQRSLGRGESPLEAMGHGANILFTAPFLEGQIATKAFYNMLNNKNSKDEAIFFEHDDLGTKAAKGLASFAKEAYGVPTFMRLSENIKGIISDDPSYTMGKLLRDEFSPLKPYEIKPQTALFNFTRPLEQDKLAMRKAINKLATSKPVTDDELRSVLQNLIKSYGRTAKTFKRNAAAFTKLGATPEEIRKIGGQLFTQEGYKNIMLNNAVPALFFSDRMKEVFKRSSNPEVRARLSRSASILLEGTNNGMIPLD